MLYLSLLLIFLRLGCTSFGGPVAHLGYFREEFVTRRKWLTEVEYANLIALCQFIPGPASSQVGAAVGYARGGYLGAILAWIGFTLPSALLMVTAAFSLLSFQGTELVNGLHGLKLVAVAIVAQAVWGMQKQLCNTLTTRVIALLAVVLLLAIQWPFMQWIVIAGGLISGAMLGSDTKLSQSRPEQTSYPTKTQSHKTASVIFLSLFSIGLVLLPVMAADTNSQIALFDKFYRAGALVFGGGHVVLPLLLNEFVPTGLITETDFFIGYGAAQALPGPLFTFATFIGAASIESPPIISAIVATIGIFLPGMLLLFAVLPHWHKVSQYELAKRCLIGVNASVVGILLAALIDPIITTTISTVMDVAIVMLALTALIRFKVHPLWAVLGCVVGHGIVVLF